MSAGAKRRAAAALTDALSTPMADDYVLRREAERILARNSARLAAIERDLVARIVSRVGAGEDPNVATLEEIRRALATLDAASDAVHKELAALGGSPVHPNRPRGR